MAHWDLPEAPTTRTVDVTPVLSLERVREPGDILAMPVVIADLAVLAQVFLAERALNVLEILHCLVALSFCGSVGCLGGVARLLGSAKLRLKLRLSWGSCVYIYMSDLPSAHA